MPEIVRLVVLDAVDQVTERFPFDIGREVGGHVEHIVFHCQLLVGTGAVLEEQIDEDLIHLIGGNGQRCFVGGILVVDQFVLLVIDELADRLVYGCHLAAATALDQIRVTEIEVPLAEIDVGFLFQACVNKVLQDLLH